MSLFKLTVVPNGIDGQNVKVSVCIEINKDASNSRTAFAQWHKGVEDMHEEWGKAVKQLKFTIGGLKDSETIIPDAEIEPKTVTKVAIELWKSIISVQS